MTNQGQQKSQKERGSKEEGPGSSRPTEGDVGHRTMRGLRALGLLALLALVDGSWSSSVQDKARDIVMEFFHSRSFVQYLFKERAVATVETEELPMGTYINLEVELDQTLCRKNQQRTENCQIKSGGRPFLALPFSAQRKQTCLACFKFDANNPELVLDRGIHCLAPQSRNFQHVKNTHQQDCREVKKANEQHYLPGRFAFSRGRPL